MSDRGAIQQEIERLQRLLEEAPPPPPPAPETYSDFVERGHSDDSIPLAQVAAMLAGSLVDDEEDSPILALASANSEPSAHPSATVEASLTGEEGCHEPAPVTEVAPPPVEATQPAQPTEAASPKERPLRKKVAPAPPPGTKSLASFGFGLKQTDPVSGEKQQMKHMLFQPFQETDRRIVPTLLKAWEREGFTLGQSETDVLPQSAESETSALPDLQFEPPTKIVSQMYATVKADDRLGFLFSDEVVHDNEDDLLFGHQDVARVPRTTEVVFVGMYSLRHVPFEGRPPYFGTSNIPLFMKRQEDGTPSILSIGRFEPTTEMKQLVGEEAPDYNDDSGDDWDSEPSDGDDAMKSSSDSSDEYSEDDMSDDFINDNPSDVDSEDGAAEKAIQNNQKRLENIMRSGKLIPKAFGSFGGINLPAHPYHFKKDYIDQLPLAQQDTGMKDQSDSMSILEGRQDASCDGVPPSEWTTCNTNGMMPTLADSYHLLLAEELRRSGLAPRSQLVDMLASIHNKIRTERTVLRDSLHENSLSMLVHGGAQFSDQDATTKGTGIKVPSGLLGGTTGSLFEIQEQQRRAQDALKSRGVITEQHIAQLKLFVKGAQEGAQLLTKEMLKQEASRICPDVTKQRLDDIILEQFIQVARKFVARDSLTDADKEIINNDGRLSNDNVDQLKQFAESQPIKLKNELVLEAIRICPFANRTKVNQMIDEVFIRVENRYRAKDLLPINYLAQRTADIQSARLKAKDEERQRGMIQKLTQDATPKALGDKSTPVLPPTSTTPTSASAQAEEAAPEPHVMGGIALSYLDEGDENDDEEDIPLAFIVATSPSGIGAKRERTE